MTPSVFPQRYSLYRQQRRYLVDFRRNEQQVTLLWDPRKPFALGAPARFYLKKEKSRVHLIDRQNGGHGIDVATVKFDTPLSVKLHPGDVDPWVITLRATAPYEPIAFRNPETLEITDVAPPFCIYSGLRRRLLSQNQVGEHFRIHISSNPVFGYEYREGQHTITALQEDVTWRNFDGECQELIKDVAFSLDNLFFLEGWVEWKEHWWRMVPNQPTERTELFVVRHQDPSFLARYTTIAASLVAWSIWLLVPMHVTDISEPPSQTTSITIQSPKTFVFPRPPGYRPPQESVEEREVATKPSGTSDKSFIKKKTPKSSSSDDVTVKITTPPLEQYEEEGTTVVGTTEGVEEQATPEEAPNNQRIPRGLIFNQSLGIKGNGTIVRAAVVKTLERQRNNFQECYHDLARKNPEAKGTVLLNWTISRYGKAEDVSIFRSDIKESGFMDCLKKLIQSTDFPRPKRDSVDIEMPFIVESMGH